MRHRKASELWRAQLRQLLSSPFMVRTTFFARCVHSNVFQMLQKRPREYAKPLGRDDLLVNSLWVLAPSRLCVKFIPNQSRQIAHEAPCKWPLEFPPPAKPLCSWQVIESRPLNIQDRILTISICGVWVIDYRNNSCQLLTWLGDGQSFLSHIM